MIANDVNPIILAIAQNILGEIDELGFCRCPGEHLHTKKTAARDCRVWLRGIPSIYCFHSSCCGIVGDINHRLRSAIAKAQPGDYKPSPENRERQRAALAAKRKVEALRTRAANGLTEIVQDFACDPRDLLASSPEQFSNPLDDWRRLLELYAPGDVLWIGGLTDSCDATASDERKVQCAQHFHTVSEWLRLDSAPGNFTCPTTFKNNCYSRSNANVLTRKYLAVESDSLTKNDITAVFKWISQFLRCRAVVDTGGKSLHGWFDLPSPDVETELKTILPAMQCDPALFKHAQPCRLPGAWRAEKNSLQKLVYLDLGGIR